jgi:putative PIG3 family NAD(P)H quinone oxidoreductase
MALLAGGGYSEQVVVHAGSVMAVPAGMSLVSAAAIPEVFLTCHLNLFRIAASPTGGWALVHGGGSGIGTAAIQRLSQAGGRSIVTAGSADKCALCRELGADVAINYNEEDFAARVLEATDGAGVDVALDSIGAPYLDSHLRCLAVGGRLVLIGLMGGARTDINLAQLMMRRLTIVGSTLRARPVDEKAALVADFQARFGEDLAAERIRPTIDRVLPLAEAQQAHELLESSTHFGKVVLQVREEAAS